jgi:hypothetical protein
MPHDSDNDPHGEHDARARQRVRDNAMFLDLYLKTGILPANVPAPQVAVYPERRETFAAAPSDARC